MFEVNSNHCQIVNRSLAGERAVDEQTFSSLAILTERMERLKEVDGAFSNVGFSSSVMKLKERANAVAIG